MRNSKLLNPEAKVLQAAYATACRDAGQLQERGTQLHCTSRDFASYCLGFFFFLSDLFSQQSLREMPFRHSPWPVSLKQAPAQQPGTRHLVPIQSRDTHMYARIKESGAAGAFSKTLNPPQNLWKSSGAHQTKACKHKH